MEFVPLFKILIGFYKPEVYVEVGVQHAKTFNEISPLVPLSVAVDINPMPEVRGRSGVRVYQMDSLYFAKTEMPMIGRIDLLFIDADHKKESVLADFDALSPFVTPGTGLILLHDTYPSAPYLLKEGCCFNAWEAAEVIHKNEKYQDFEIVTLPGPHAGLSIIRKAKKHLVWREAI